jgi:acyl-CoA synthetase (AMP-forming)/AMP-acid ligase II
MDIELWAGRVHLLNGYGPAECSTLSTIHNGITRHDPAGKIGFPSCCKCWIVDPNNHERLLPIGAPGEFLIEGHLVGRGYLNDEARTAAVFIKPPQWLLAVRHGVETKVYRTGDIAKYDTDGSIIYLHRKDSQVKLRGQRFDVGEVEHHVQRNFPGATNVVAEVVERQGQMTPFAFILSNEDNTREATAGNSDSRLFHGATEAFTAAVTAVEAQIRQSLPSVMIPTTFIPPVRMPYTLNPKTTQERLLQVILRELPIPFQHISGIKDLAGYSQALWEADATGNNVVPGIPTKFILLSDIQAKKHILIIRLTRPVGRRLYSIASQ